VLSAKMTDPQFSGQTKESASPHGSRLLCQRRVKDSFSLWLNHHTEPVKNWPKWPSKAPATG
jgi:topoisomerase-4 subunit B